MTGAASDLSRWEGNFRPFTPDSLAAIQESGLPSKRRKRSPKIGKQQNLSLDLNRPKGLREVAQALW